MLFRSRDFGLNRRIIASSVIRPFSSLKTFGATRFCDLREVSAFFAVKSFGDVQHVGVVLVSLVCKCQNLETAEVAKKATKVDRSAFNDSIPR